MKTRFYFPKVDLELRKETRIRTPEWPAPIRSADCCGFIHISRSSSQQLFIRPKLCKATKNRAGWSKISIYLSSTINERLNLSVSAFFFVDNKNMNNYGPGPRIRIFPGSDPDWHLKDCGSEPLHPTVCPWSIVHFYKMSKIRKLDKSPRTYSTSGSYFLGPGRLLAALA